MAKNKIPKRGRFLPLVQRSQMLGSWLFHAVTQSTQSGLYTEGVRDMTIPRNKSVMHITVGIQKRYRPHNGMRAMHTGRRTYSSITRILILDHPLFSWRNRYYTPEKENNLGEVRDLTERIRDRQFLVFER